MSLPGERDLLGAAIMIIATLVWWELRRGEPFLDVRMLAADRREPG